MRSKKVSSEMGSEAPHRLFLGCVARKEFISPLVLHVWQGKELEARILEVWQGKELGDLGPGMEERGGKRGLLENNIHHYNMDVNIPSGALGMGEVRSGLWAGELGSWKAAHASLREAWGTREKKSQNPHP
jgi:hypothetical protein